jgi:hypothetical protein
MITTLTIIIILKMVSYIQVNNEIFVVWRKINQFKTNQYYRDLLAKH